MQWGLRIDIVVGHSHVKTSRPITTDDLDSATIRGLSDRVPVDQHRGVTTAIDVDADAVAELGAGAGHAGIADRVAGNRSRKTATEGGGPAAAKRFMAWLRAPVIVVLLRTLNV